MLDAVSGMNTVSAMKPDDVVRSSSPAEIDVGNLHARAVRLHSMSGMRPSRLSGVWWEPDGTEPAKTSDPKRKRRKVHRAVPLWSWIATGVVLSVLGGMAYLIIRRGRNDGGDDDDAGTGGGGSGGGWKDPITPSRAGRSENGDGPEPPIAALSPIDPALMSSYQGMPYGYFNAFDIVGVQTQLVAFSRMPCAAMLR